MSQQTLLWQIDQQQQTIEQIAQIVTQTSGTIFRVLSPEITHSLIAQALQALQQALNLEPNARIRITVIDAMARTAQQALSFQDLRLLSNTMRDVILPLMQESDHNETWIIQRVQEWFYQFALQCGVYSLAQREELIEQQATALEIHVAELQSLNEEQNRLLELLQQVSTPIASIYDGILVVPLVGALDTHRSQALNEQLLEAILAKKAQVVIVDISGVPVFDTAIAQRLIHTAKAAHLLGAQLVLVGISPDVAQSVVQLGISLDGLISRHSLQEGLAYGLTRLNHRIVRNS